MTQEVTIDVSSTGDITVGVTGVSGPDCQQLTKAIEDALGTVTAVKKTAAYHASKPVLRKAGA